MLVGLAGKKITSKDGRQGDPLVRANCRYMSMHGALVHVGTQPLGRPIFTLPNRATSSRHVCDVLRVGAMSIPSYYHTALKHDTSFGFCSFIVASYALL